MENNNNSGWIWWILVVIVIVGAGWWYLSSQSSPVETPSTTTDTTTVPVPENPATAQVTYDGTSFSPASVTVKPGGTVTFTSTAGNMWVASAPHPAHTGYDGTSAQVHCAAGYTGAAPFDQCVAGTSFSFTFNKTGTWPFHNHLNSSAFGKVVVQ